VRMPLDMHDFKLKRTKNSWIFYKKIMIPKSNKIRLQT